MSTLTTYQLSGGIATITMDDGKANAMSVAMLDELAEAFDKAEADKAVVILTGRERTFSGGFDLGAFKREKTELVQMLSDGARLTERLMSFPYPVVAVCGGNAVAMGVFLLLCADVRMGASPGAEQGTGSRVHINEVKNGMILPHFAIAVCRQRLAPAHLHHAITTAQPYGAQQALEAGFFDSLSPLEDLQAVARTRAEGLITLNMPAFKATKLRLQHAVLASLKTAVEDDIAGWAALLKA